MTHPRFRPPQAQPNLISWAFPFNPSYGASRSRETLTPTLSPSRRRRCKGETERAEHGAALAEHGKPYSCLLRLAAPVQQHPSPSAAPAWQRPSPRHLTSPSPHPTPRPTREAVAEAAASYSTSAVRARGCRRQLVLPFRIADLYPPSRGCLHGLTHEPPPPPDGEPLRSLV